MSFIINNKGVTESFFWHSLEGIASERQIYMIAEGKPVIIGGIQYRIEIAN